MKDATRSNFPRSFLPDRRRAVAGALILLLSACSGGGLPGFEQTPAVPPIGNAGTVKIALILPLSAGGQTAIAANSLKNAGELAIA
ncbi:MAG: penicillin-binding protein activator, partial [Hyphomicrobiales bacterium]|nr:penicillin-binding protein activator [Hyphomicrobiales bacterium]